mmetsp:Transcript_4623/g.13976  ORF Transcript_4623/g.13976 Transcript_4623/m.13976 type:complete len:166 (+) Transcript_4623:344-841(+)
MAFVISSIVPRRPRGSSVSRNTRFANDGDTIGWITAKEVIDGILKEELTVVDLREDGRRGGHLRGSRHIPFSFVISKVVNGYCDDLAYHSKIAFLSEKGRMLAETGARAFRAALVRRHLHSPAQVFAVNGGMRDIVRQYKHRRELFVNLQLDLWDEMDADDEESE